jgi:hypothetical protein
MIAERLESFNRDFDYELHFVTYSGGTSRAAVNEYLDLRGYSHDPDIVISSWSFIPTTDSIITSFILSVIPMTATRIRR